MRKSCRRSLVVAALFATTTHIPVGVNIVIHTQQDRRHGTTTNSKNRYILLTHQLQGQPNAVPIGPTRAIATRLACLHQCELPLAFCLLEVVGWAKRVIRVGPFLRRCTHKASSIRFAASFLRESFFCNCHVTPDRNHDRTNRGKQAD